MLLPICALLALHACGARTGLDAPFLDATAPPSCTAPPRAATACAQLAVVPPAAVNNSPSATSLFAMERDDHLDLFLNEGINGGTNTLRRLSFSEAFSLSTPIPLSVDNGLSTGFAAFARSDGFFATIAAQSIGSQYANVRIYDQLNVQTGVAALPLPLGWGGLPSLGWNAGNVVAAFTPGNSCSCVVDPTIVMSDVDGGVTYGPGNAGFSDVDQLTGAPAEGQVITTRCGTVELKFSDDVSAGSIVEGKFASPAVPSPIVPVPHDAVSPAFEWPYDPQSITWFVPWGWGCGVNPGPVALWRMDATGQQTLVTTVASPRTFVLLIVPTSFGLAQVVFSASDCVSETTLVTTTIVRPDGSPSAQATFSIDGSPPDFTTQLFGHGASDFGVGEMDGGLGFVWLGGNDKTLTAAFVECQAK